MCHESECVREEYVVGSRLARDCSKIFVTCFLVSAISIVPI